MARGIYDEAKKIVFVKGDTYCVDKGWFRPERGATVSKDGVVYSVQSKQHKDLEKIAHDL